MSRQVFLNSPAAGTTEQLASTNTAQGLPDSVKYRDGDSANKESNNKAKAVFITNEGNPIRYAFNATPTQDSGTGLGHILPAGSSIRLTSWEHINNFQVISQAADTHGNLQITPEY